MEGRIKTRVGGSVPNTLGRQVGVLPLSHSRQRITQRTSTQSKKSITPSSSSSHVSKSKPVSTSSGNSLPKGGDDDESDDEWQEQNIHFMNIPGSHGTGSTAIPSFPSTDSTEISSSRSTRSTAIPSFRNSGSSSASVRQDRSKKSALGSYRASRNSQTQSKASILESASSTSSPRDEEITPRKPFKTIDWEEILAQNVETDLSKVYEINLHASEITVIDNLEKFKKLRVLDLSCNFIEKIKSLEFNTDMRELKLYDNRIRTIENIDNLRELCSLHLQHNKIKTIGKGLGNLKKLKMLRLDCNQILKIDIPELSPCVQLTFIDVSYNMLDSLAALNYLPNLEELYASGNRLRSVSDLTKCRQLQEVDLSGNRLTDLSGLKGLPKLQILTVSNNQLTSLRSAGKLKSLQEIHATNNQICELKTLPSQFPALEILDIPDNQIYHWEEVCALEKLEELVELFISANPFCAQDGPMPHYMSAVQDLISTLEIVDGVHVKRQSSKGAPLMRPMTASSIVSLRQMETQMKAAADEMKYMEKSLEEKFEAIRATCDTLPSRPPTSSIMSELLSANLSESRNDSQIRISRAGKQRSRLQDAMVFAAQNNLD
ncbi:hypothetical protein ACJMK2_033456 [Sinanodonta woodiana]|uniref:Disease resistance R13L4/SHOC-2-like LRR domain-containing protein n=1 Tax=Sinanodonta woodiana TaxID=1069815 RepID=A0ABD3WNE6_SINWO